MDLEKELINIERYNYKCFDLLKELLKNENFSLVVKQGLAIGAIRGFADDEWDKIYNQNSMGMSDLEDAFRNGENIGGCTTYSVRLSYSFDNVYICGGTLSYLEGTKNSLDGRHTWMVSDGYIYDTSLMLVVKEDFANELGYVLENKQSVVGNVRYNKQKEFATDSRLSSKKRNLFY